MPLDLPNPMTNITFGGYLTGGGAGGSNMVKGATPMTMVSATAAKTQSLSVAGTAGLYNDDGVQTLIGELKAAAAAAAPAASRAAHTQHWSDFWANADLTITAAARPADPETAAQAEHVTLLDKVNRAAFHSMAAGALPVRPGLVNLGHQLPPVTCLALPSDWCLCRLGVLGGNNAGKISAIKFNAYGIFSAYPSPLEDYRIWGPCQWFQNIRLPYCECRYFLDLDFCPPSTPA